MATQDLPDIYAHVLGPVALGLGHIYIRQIRLGHGITIKYIFHDSVSSLAQI